MVGAQLRRNVPPGEARSSPGLRIVVVDDQPDAVLALTLLLNECGHRVRSAYRGADALQAIADFMPDAVLLDIGLPDVSGYEVARALRARHGRNCPLLVAVTVHKDEADKVRAREAGIDRHLAKPYAPDELLALLDGLSPRTRPIEVARKARFQVRLAGSYLRAEIFNRRSGEETKAFLEAIAAESGRTGCVRVLVCVRGSLPIFKVEQYGLSALLKRIAATPGARIAITADSIEVRAAHQYVELLARQQGCDVRAFASEAPAVEWLTKP
jgi:CheY-like chemotaxis protein